MTSTEFTAAPEPAAAAPQPKYVAPKAASRTTTPTPKKKAPTAHKRAKVAKPAAKKATGKPAPKAAAAPAAPPDNKKAMILDLLHRKGGATLAEIAKATGWQNHSIRGFISGIASKRMGLKIESTRDEQGQRRYRAAK